MGRKQAFRAASAQEVCIFCACRLGIRNASLGTSSTRSFTSSARSAINQTASQQQGLSSAGPNTSSVFKPDPASSLSVAEQLSKFNRLRIQEEAENARREQRRKDEAQEQRIAAAREKARNGPTISRMNVQPRDNKGRGRDDQSATADRSKSGSGLNKKTFTRSSAPGSRAHQASDAFKIRKIDSVRPDSQTPPSQPERTQQPKDQPPIFSMTNNRRRSNTIQRNGDVVSKSVNGTDGRATNASQHAAQRNRSRETDSDASDGHSRTSKLEEDEGAELQQEVVEGRQTPRSFSLFRGPPAPPAPSDITGAAKRAVTGSLSALKGPSVKLEADTTTQSPVKKSAPTLFGAMRSATGTVTSSAGAKSAGWGAGSSGVKPIAYGDAEALDKALETLKQKQAPAEPADTRHFVPLSHVTGDRSTEAAPQGVDNSLLDEVFGTHQTRVSTGGVTSGDTEARSVIPAADNSSPQGVNNSLSDEVFGTSQTRAPASGVTDGEREMPSDVPAADGPSPQPQAERSINPELQTAFQALEQELKEGEITQKGYDKRRAALQGASQALEALEQELKEGEITQRGYEKRRAALLPNAVSSVSASSQAPKIEPLADTYRAVPVSKEEFAAEYDRGQENESQLDWSHLRPRSADTDSQPPAPSPKIDDARASRRLPNAAEIDRSFEQHRQSRAAVHDFAQPPPPAADRFEPVRGADRRSVRCGRCGQEGHFARECEQFKGKQPSRGAGPNQHKKPEQLVRFSFSNPANGLDEKFVDPSIVDTPMGMAARKAGGAPELPRKETLSASTREAKFELDQELNGSHRYTPPVSSRNNEEYGNMRDIPSPNRAQEDLLASRPGRDSAEERMSALTETPVEPVVDEVKSRRASRWEDDDEASKDDDRGKSSKASKRGRRGVGSEDAAPQRSRGSRAFEDDDDEGGAAREDARVRKAARQAERAAKKAAEQEAARAEREARKAAQTSVIKLPEFVSVQNLAQSLGVRYERFVDRLEELGYDDIFPGKVLNSEISGMIAMEYNFEPIFEAGVHEDESRDLKALPVVDPTEFPVRPPVVTIMGHVDHGKTTILDYLRKSNRVAGEAGGITQHIGAFSVPMSSSGKTITFLDTPGHEAFLSMRQRGANVTDIVVLVVAADDSVKPQTLEALKHARAANVPMIVAINKIDKESADIDRCKQDLARNGVEIEDYGGETQVVPISGKTGQGMDELEENLVTLSEILDHRADHAGQVEGWVIEATTKLSGRVATILVRRGTLRTGDILVAGKTWARVRTLRNESDELLEEVGPGMPVEVDGWNEQPVAGDEVLQAPNEQKANSVVDYRIEKEERERTAKDTEVINESRRQHQLQRAEEKAAEAAARMTARERRLAGEEEDVTAPSTAQENQDPEQREDGQRLVPFIIKADVSGSAEAVAAYVLGVSHPLIAPKILYSAVGPVHESDITLAATAKGQIIAFNLPQNNESKALAESQGVTILENNIIYRVLDDVKATLEKELPPVIVQKVIGEAEIGQAFDINIKGRKFVRIAGCKVRNGSIKKGSRARVMRDGEKIYDGRIDSLKNVKKDVEEMRKGSECGMGFEDWQEFEVGDQIQTYEQTSEKRKL